MPSQQALFEVRQRHRDREDLLLLATTYWTLGSQPKKVDPSFQQEQMGHACEWETSMMLVIRPELVKDFERVEPCDFGRGFAPASRAWITKDRTADGHIGYSNLASAEKGEKLFQMFSADVVQMLQRVADWDGKSWDA